MFNQVIIEPGTWSGYKLILEARNMVLNVSENVAFVCLYLDISMACLGRSISSRVRIVGMS